MDVKSLFGDVPVAKFVEEYLHRLPFALAGSARGVCELGTWDAVGAMLAEAGEDAFAVRGGEWYEGDAPRNVAAARALNDEGYTIFIRHAERHHALVAELAAAFERTFLGAVNVHVFATAAGAPGFSWHYDAEDVFIIQTAGEKEYSLRKNTVNPWPLEETLPEDMRYEREQMPLMRVLLRAGDLLYIPCGYWHRAEAKGLSHEQEKGTDPEAAISLAVGVMSRSAMDVYDFLRGRLVQSLVWRQRLPLVGAASPTSREELEATYRQIFEQLAGDLAKALADPRLVAEFLEWLGTGGAGAEDGPARTACALEEPTDRGEEK
ncbi:MAG: cupin domain-containing protein [Pirellulales bacterium]